MGFNDDGLGAAMALAAKADKPPSPNRVCEKLIEFTAERHETRDNSYRAFQIRVWRTHKSLTGAADDHGSDIRDAAEQGIEASLSSGIDPSVLIVLAIEKLTNIAAIQCDGVILYPDWH